jgi:ATP-dependent exoDNAse (exonuclease V) beta subunit
MYVAFTRARDVLILGSNGQDMKYLNEAGIDTNKMQKDLEPAISFTPIDRLELKEETRQVISLAKDSAEPLKRRDVAPSKVAACECKVLMVAAEDGERIDVKALRHVTTEDERYQILGDCIHQALCGIEYLSDDKLCALIKGWGLEQVLKAEQVRATWERLMKLLTKHYGAAYKCVHEDAFRHHKEGQIISGSIDLVYYLNEKEVVLVDYKTCPAGQARILDETNGLYAGKYSGQLATYKNALEADGKCVKASLIYYPISGMLVSVEDKE